MISRITKNPIISESVRAVRATIEGEESKRLCLYFWDMTGNQYYVLRIGVNTKEEMVDSYTPDGFSRNVIV